MSHKKRVGILLSVSILGFLGGILLTEPTTFGLCGAEERFGCIRPLHTVGQPLFMGSVAIAVIFLILLFLPPLYFQRWLTYAAWFIPVGIILIVSSDVNCSGGLGLGLCFDKELATWWSSGIYLVFSLVVIGITALKQRRRSSSSTPGV